ncbi:hypothetical protein PVAND_000077 [Polypedilum vanderplanki]|uniref:Uncharacterized protein n=1 Tax=Polypedilum vanderplanki TaxID=319348 RepID=A0A9J6BJB0_POLVA|nr:hypothetical protein PVAND_000077 [Polypedilum vanderplanki]
MSSSDLVFMTVGAHKYTDDGEEFELKPFWIHENFTMPSAVYDIAVVGFTAWFSKLTQKECKLCCFLKVFRRTNSSDDGKACNNNCSTNVSAVAARLLSYLSLISEITGIIFENNDNKI